MSPSDLKPIKVWTTSAGPNGWKPVIILEELEIPYDLQKLNFDQLVSPEFRKLTPVGKVPLMYDPNTDIQIFESGAIILYLIETYDKDHRLTYTTSKEKALQNQWLMYQVSGQGPMFGQFAWFATLHPEQLPSATTRYKSQVHLTLSILESVLSKNTSNPSSPTTSGPWLVGDRLTYADLSFFPWNEIIPLPFRMTDGATPLSKYPAVLAWHERMKGMESVKRTWEIRSEMMKEEKLDAGGLPEGRNWREIVEKIEARE